MSASDPPPIQQTSPRRERRTRPGPAAALGAALAVMGLAGCQAPFERHQAEIRAHLDEGRYDLIAAALDDPDNELHDRKADQLIWLLDRGTVALLLDDPDTTIDVLNQAEALMEQRREQALLADVAALTINDQMTTYLGEPYEDIYVNVLKMLAQLEAGRLRGGATVEARRLATKVDLLRDEYLELERQVSTMDPSSPVRSRAPAHREVATARGGEFIDSTLGTYLTAVTYMHTGERQNQVVAARRLRQAIEAQQQLIGPVDAGAYEDLGTLRPEDGNLLVVALSGRGPYKDDEKIGPIIVYGTPIYFELPVLHDVPSPVAGVRLRFEGEALPTVNLHFIEDIGAVAYENNRREMPLIYARTMARAAAKSFALHTATRAAYEGSGEDAGAAALAAVAGLMLLMGTEQADLRCWTMLPGQAHVNLLKVEPGHHRVAVEFVDARGVVLYRAPPRDLDIVEGGLTTVVESFWR
jgi:hypothetical protein